MEFRSGMSLLRFLHSSSCNSAFKSTVSDSVYMNPERKWSHSGSSSHRVLVLDRNIQSRTRSYRVWQIPGPDARDKLKNMPDKCFISRRSPPGLKPGLHIIVQVAPIVSIFSDISKTTGTTQTIGTSLWFPYNRFVRLPRGCLVEVLNPSTIFWCENHF